MSCSFSVLSATVAADGVLDRQLLERYPSIDTWRVINCRDQKPYLLRRCAGTWQRVNESHGVSKTKELCFLQKQGWLSTSLIPVTPSALSRYVRKQREQKQQAGPLAVVAWGLAALATLSHMAGEALAYRLVGGTEFQVNSAASIRQVGVSVSGLADGGFVMFWSGVDPVIDDRMNAFGRIYADADTPLGPEFVANTVRIGQNSWNPSVAGLASGGFVVVWQGPGQPVFASSQIFGRVYTSRGAYVTGEFPVTASHAGEQRYPSVAALRDGGFIVFWHGIQPSAGWACFGRIYDSFGVAQPTEFRISASNGVQIGCYGVASLVDGGFVVWWSEGNATSREIFARRYNAGGMETPPDVKLAEGDIYSTRGSGLAAGGYVSTWEHADRRNIFVRSYTTVDQRLGPVFQVNSATSEILSFPGSVGLSDGDFLVTWVRNRTTHGRRCNEVGMPSGSEFDISTALVASNSVTSNLASLTNGGFVVAGLGSIGGNISRVIGRVFRNETLPTTESFTTALTSDAGTSQPPKISTQAGIMTTDRHLPLEPTTGQPIDPLPVGLGGASAVVCSILSAVGLVVIIRQRRMARQNTHQDRDQPTTVAPSYSPMPRPGEPDEGSSLPAAPYRNLPVPVSAEPIYKTL